MRAFLLGLLTGIVFLTGADLLARRHRSLGAAVPSNGGQICIYNATTTALVLQDGFGSALACDNQGRLITTSN